MPINPCCGGSLQSGVKAVAAAEFFISTSFFITGVIAIQKFANDGGDVPSLLFGLGYLFFSLIQFTLTVFLFIGCNKKNYSHAMKWFLGSWLLLLFLVVFAAFETFQGRLTANILWAKPLLLGFVCLLKLYCLWVVFEFIGEIKYAPGTGSRRGVKAPI